jgi:hypothetical protein
MSRSLSPYSATQGLFNNPYASAQLTPSKFAAPRAPLTTVAVQNAEQKRLAKNAKARERAAAKRALNPNATGQKGKPKQSLTERLQKATAEGKLLDVTPLAKGESAKLIATPGYLRSRVGVIDNSTGLQGLNVVSSDRGAYQSALQQLGVSNVNSYLQVWDQMKANPQKGGNRARGPPKSKEELQAKQRQYRLTSTARRKLKAGKTIADLSAAEQNALAISDANLAQRYPGRLAQKPEAQRLSARLSPRKSPLSPRSAQAFQNM